MSKRMVSFRVDTADWEGFKHVAEFFGLSPSELLRCEISAVQGASLVKYERGNMLHLPRVRIPDRQKAKAA